MEQLVNREMKTVKDFVKVAELQLTYKSKVKQSDRPSVSSSADAYSVLSALWHDDIELRERFYVLTLNRANKVTGINCISAGGITGTIADIQLIAATVILSNSKSCIVAHNHPSGNLLASESDINLTKKIKEALSTFDSTLLDHLILTPEKYFSFADEGMI